MNWDPDQRKSVYHYKKELPLVRNVKCNNARGAAAGLQLEVQSAFQPPAMPVDAATCALTVTARLPVHSDSKMADFQLILLCIRLIIRAAQHSTWPPPNSLAARTN